jgi:hypothetical protein
LARLWRAKCFVVVSACSNAYAQLGDQAACCAPAGDRETAVHQALTALLRKYDINEYAASVHVYALKAP